MYKSVKNIQNLFVRLASGLANIIIHTKGFCKKNFTYKGMLGPFKKKCFCGFKWPLFFQYTLLCLFIDTTSFTFLVQTISFGHRPNLSLPKEIFFT